MKTNFKFILVVLLLFIVTSLVAQESPGNVSSGLSLWLKADTGVTVTSSQITLWEDQSVNGYDVINGGGAVEQATTGPSLSNFNPVVSFDRDNGGDEDLRNTSAIILADGDTTHSSYLVLKNNQTNGTFTEVFNYAAHHDETPKIEYNGGGFNGGLGTQWTATSLSSSGGVPAGDTPDFNNWTILSLESDGTNSTSYNSGNVGASKPALPINRTDPNKSTTFSPNGFSVGSNLAIANGSTEADIAEIIVYDESTGVAGKQKIESYLAIKYGITLNSGATDYFASDGTIIWPVDAGYASDIFGIANDDNQGLDQQISKSVNTGSILTLSNDTNFTTANGTHASLTDGQFLVLGNNGLATTAQTTEIGADIISGINREWKVQNTGNVGAVNLKFDGFDSNYSVLKSTTGDFSTGATSLGRLNADGELTGVTLTNNTFITLAIGDAPGAITSSLALWLKADVGGAAWTDQSGNSTVVSTVGSPTLNANSLNFNDKVTFNGSTDYYDLTNAAIENGTGDKAIYVVSQRNADAGAIYTVSLGTTISSGTGALSFGHWSNFPNDPFISTSGQEVTSGDESWFINTPTITGYSLIGGTNALYTNGVNLGIAQDDVTVNINNGSDSRIGRFATIGGLWSGDIAEVIVYNSGNSTGTERQQIESYLAIKYGITMNSGNTAYLASDGTIVWPVDADYASDIFGIANDDDQGLDQQISKSVNTGSILTLSNDTNFTTANGTHASLTDGQFLVVGNDGASGNVSDVNSTDLDATKYFRRAAREWKSVNTGTIAGNTNLQFDGYDATWVLLTRTTNGDFSATTGTTETALSGTGTVAIALPGTTYFTLAQKATFIEFELATANDDETAGANLPNLIIDGTLHAATEIDILVNAASTATPGTDFTFGGLTAAGTVTVVIPAATYSSATPIALTSLEAVDRLRASYPSVINNSPTNTQQEETFVAKFTGTYQLTYSAENFTSFDGTTGDGFPRVGTTPGVPDGSFDALDGRNDRITTTTPSKTYTVDLTAGTTYYVYSLAGGRAEISNVALELEYLRPINFAISNDALLEANETINMSLSNAQPGLIFQEVISGTLISDHVYTITDDDDPVLSITVTTDGAEPSTSAVFTVAIDGGVVNNTGADITGTLTLSGEATAVDDYGNMTSFAIPNGAASTTLSIIVSDDAIIEGDETLIATISAPSRGTVNATANVANGKITDNDTAGFTLTPLTLTVNENVGTGTFTIVLDAQPLSDVAFTITSADVNEATVNPTILLFPAASWNVPQTITVTGVNDETFTTDNVLITVAVNDTFSPDAYDNLADQTVSVTLSNEDIVVGPELSTAMLSIDENDGMKTFTVVLGSQPTNDVILNIISADILEATVDLAQLTFTNANWDTTQEIKVTGVDDNDLIGDTTTISVGVDPSSDLFFTSLDPKIVNVTLINDDISTNAPGSTLAEADGSAIANGTDTEIITVQLKGDDGIDIKRAGINVTFAVTGSATLSNATATTDANGTVTISITNTIAETVDVTATINTDNDNGTTAEVAVTNGSPTQVTFTVDVTSQTILAQIGNEGDDPDMVNSVVTVVQLAMINGITGVIPTNEVHYQNYIDNNPNSFDEPATQAQVQAMIDAVNVAVIVSNEILTQIGEEGDSPDNVPSVVTVAELGTVLIAVTDLVPANETAYQAYIDANPNNFDAPATQMQVQEMVDAVNDAQDLLIAIGIDEDDDAATTTGATAEQLNAIVGVTGAIAANESVYQAYIDANEGNFSSPATAEEVQIMIDAVNAAETLLAAIGIDEDDDAATTTDATADQLNGIIGVSGAIAANEAEYQAYIDANEGNFDSPATAVEVQTMIDAVNASENILEQIGDEGDDPDTVPSAVTTAELEMITGITGVASENESEYQAYIDANPELFSAPATVTQVQDMIDAVNTSENILEQIGNEGDDPDTVPSAVTTAELEMITGITGVDSENESEYQAYIDANPDLFSAPATVTQVQEMVDAVNAAETLLAAIGIDEDDDAATTTDPTADQLNAIVGVSGALTANESAYQAYIDANEGNFESPATAVEVQIMIDAVNAAETLLAAIGIDEDDDVATTTGATAIQLNGIIGVSRALAANESAYQAYIDANEGNFDSPATAMQVQTMIDAVNAAEALLTAIGIDEEDDAATTTNATADQLNGIVGVSGAIAANESAYQAYIDANVGNFASPATAVEVQTMIDAVNTTQSLLVTIGIDEDDDAATTTGATAEQLNAIVGVSGAIAANESAYQEYISANEGNFTSPATAAQVQIMIDAVNAAETLLAAIGIDEEDDTATTTNATADQLNGIVGVSGAITANEAEYQEYIDANAGNFDSPATAVEVQIMIDIVNLSESVLTQIGTEGDDPDSVPSVVTVAQLETIIGITGVDPANESLYQQYIDSNPEAFSSPATLEEVQAMINEVNEIAEIVANSNDPADGNPSESELIAVGVTEVNPEYIDKYEEAIANASPAPVSLEELQLIIDAVNEVEAGIIASLAEILEDSNSPDGEDDANGTSVTVSQLEEIPGLVNIITDNEEAYQIAINNETSFSNPPTIEEIQEVIDRVNTLIELIENANNPADGNPSISDLSDVGIVDLDPLRESLYEEAIANVNPQPQSLEELQAIIDQVNNTPLNVVSAEAFTPNGDGINDNWVIDGILDHPNNTVRLFNRWGHEVLNVRGYQNDWEGNYKDNSKKLPPGSYYYIVDLGDGTTPQTGWIFVNY